MSNHISTGMAAPRPALCLCLVAPSGSGKSTTAQLIRDWLLARGHTVEVVKLAEPLYRIQAMFYAEAGIALTPETQDQKLLESVATHLRTIHARALADGFLRRLAASRADVVINDDLRDDRIDWPALREAGFRVVKVAARAEVRVQRLAERNDLSVVKDSPLDLQMARIEADYVLTNNGSLGALEVQVDGLCRLLVGERAEAAA
jgi:dephospho-CoA kinase